MNNFLKVFSLFLLGIISVRVVAEEAPDHSLAEEALQDLGYSYNDESYFLAKALIKLEYLVEEKSLRRSNAVVLKRTEKYENMGGLPGMDIPQYIEFTFSPSAPGVFSERPIPPEEVQRRKMEASGVPPEKMAEAMKMYAGGAMMVGEALREEVAGSPMKGFLDQQLGFSYDMSSPGTRQPNEDPFQGPTGAAANWDDLELAEQCQAVLELQTGDETDRARSRRADLEIKPWTSINPATFMMGPACMALYASDVLSSTDVRSPAETQETIDAMDAAMERFHTVGTEVLNGRPVARIRLDDVNLTQPIAGLPLAELSRQSLAANNEQDSASDGDRTPTVYDYSDDAPFIRAQSGGSGNGTFAINTMEIWIDTEYFVRRKMRMEGVMTDQGESRDVFLEQELQDYRNVPDSYLYMPYRQVMRAGGMMTEAQRAELVEAQAQLEEFEQQMAAMPAGQRQMMDA